MISVLFFLLSAFLLLFLFLASLVLFGFPSRFLWLVFSLSTYGCTTFIPKIKQEKRLNEQEVYRFIQNCSVPFLNLQGLLMRYLRLKKPDLSSGCLLRESLQSIFLMK